MDNFGSMALNQTTGGSLLTVFVAFALLIPAIEACLRFFNWCMFAFSDTGGGQ